MKTSHLIACALLALGACQQQQATETVQAPAPASAPATPDSLLFGVSVDATKALAVEALPTQMAGKDSVSDLTVKGKVVEVCQKKGCWMKIAQEGQEPMRITFKDYALFMPKDLAGKEVVIHGVAKTTTVSVEDLRHYAQDAGKSEKEIKAINKPETKLAFEADGVAIQQ